MSIAIPLLFPKGNLFQHQALMCSRPAMAIKYSSTGTKNNPGIAPRVVVVLRNEIIPRPPSPYAGSAPESYGNIPSHYHTTQPPSQRCR